MGLPAVTAAGAAAPAGASAAARAAASAATAIVAAAPAAVAEAAAIPVAAAEASAAPAVLASATAASALFTRTGLVNGQGASAEARAVELGDRRRARFGALHLDETEAARLARVPILDDLCVGDRSELGKHIAELIRCRTEGQTAHVDSHNRSPEKKTKALTPKFVPNLTNGKSRVEPWSNPTVSRLKNPRLGGG